MKALITRAAPGYMYDVDLVDEQGMRMRYYGTACYTLSGARRAAKRLLKRAEKDGFANGYREEVRL